MVPLLWGFAIAYILNPIMKYFEKNLKTIRPVSILITYSLVVGILAIFITLLVPQIVKNISDLISNMPTYAYGTKEWVTQFISNNQYLKDSGLLNNLENYATTLINQVGSIASTSATVLLTEIFKFASSFLSVVFGFVISIYILLDKEKFIKDAKRLLRAVLDESKFDNLISFLKEVDETFSKYITGKFIDSVVIGILCFIGLTIMHVPYSIIIALILIIANMVPYFGPIVGGVIGFLITLFYNPIQAIWVLLLILCLQQLDGWVIEPRIVGNKVGLGPFWIIVAIIIGGGTLGILGMILGVPTAAVIKIYLGRFVEKREEKKKKALLK